MPASVTGEVALVDVFWVVVGDIGTVADDEGPVGSGGEARGNNMLGVNFGSLVRNAGSARDKAV